ncbi:TPA: hypothetical protein ACLA53_002160, partial [Neisseria meningitidis]
MRVAAGIALIAFSVSVLNAVSLIFPNSFFNQLFSESEISAWSIFAAIKARDLCKIPFPHDNRNPNTGFRLFSPQIPPDFTQI